jgi:hypothetical protein
VKLNRCEVLYNNGELMVEGFGSSKKQADRNASIVGLRWLKRHIIEKPGAGAQ